MNKTLSPVDRLIIAFDEALRLAQGNGPASERPNPAGNLADIEMAEADQRHAAGLMRVNHTGEVCAQALYAGQAATARSDRVRDQMQEAAREEIDHLAWCQQRLDELGSRGSYLNPLWYAGSFTIGAVAGALGDEWSLGFLRETERQVEAHLEDHLERLPAEDGRSQAILDQMKVEEAAHAQTAEEAGARPLPRPLRDLMRVSANLMKAVAYRI